MKFYNVLYSLNLSNRIVTFVLHLSKKTTKQTESTARTYHNDICNGCKFQMFLWILAYEVAMTQITIYIYIYIYITCFVIISIEMATFCLVTLHVLNWSKVENDSCYKIVSGILFWSVDMHLYDFSRRGHCFIIQVSVLVSVIKVITLSL